jgi:hypothetical protein
MEDTDMAIEIKDQPSTGKPIDFSGIGKAGYGQTSVDHVDANTRRRLLRYTKQIRETALDHDDEPGKIGAEINDLCGKIEAELRAK